MCDKLSNNNYKELIDNPGYYITDNGDLYSSYSKKFLKGEIVGSGYKRYTISHNGIKKRYFAHRLTAEYFVENPDKEKYNIVNHLDLDKTNNNYKNLEWTDIHGNTQHAADNNKFTNKRKREYYTCDLPDEKWHTIPGLSNYSFSSYGRIKNTNNLLIRYWQRSKDNYYLVSLVNDDGHKKNYSVHRLIYISFNSDDIKENEVIDHIDGDKTNCKLSNLRKATIQENTLLSYREQKTNKRGIPIGQYDLNGNLIAKYDNANIAEEKTGISARSIREVCRGRIKTTHGFIFKDL